MPTTLSQAIWPSRCSILIKSLYQACAVSLHAELKAISVLKLPAVTPLSTVHCRGLPRSEMRVQYCCAGRLRQRLYALWRLIFSNDTGTDDTGCGCPAQQRRAERAKEQLPRPTPHGNVFTSGLLRVKWTLGALVLQKCCMSGPLFAVFRCRWYLGFSVDAFNLLTTKDPVAEGMR